MADAALPEGAVADRDDDGRVRVLRHPRGPAAIRLAEATTRPAPADLADAYVRQVAPVYGLDGGAVEDLDGAIADAPTGEPPRLKREQRKQLADLVVVSYRQTVLGLPIWQAALEVRVYADPPAVASSSSTLHEPVDVRAPDADALASLDGDDPAAVRAVLGLGGDAAPALNGTRLLAYRYDPAERLEQGSSPVAEPQLHGAPPTLALPAVDAAIEPGLHYVVRELLFSLPIGAFGTLHWRAFVEPATRSVLYLRALTASQTACVFERDPVTTTGRILSGCSAAADLDAARASVDLLGLVAPTPAGVQELRGEFVAITDTDPPPIAPPAERSPFDFCYPARSDAFAAVNAYHHYDFAYRLVEQLGFDVRAYFDGTRFPVPVDAQGFGRSVNASAEGNPAGNGMGRFRNGLSASGCPVGIAADVRVVLHEFGHALLWDHVDSPNFGWCHSAGDALGALLCDPGSRAPDRFSTFPFTLANRRHDRSVADGWAWGGSQDDTQYGSEQILATLLFAAYRAAGGDDGDEAVQRFAARYLVYLVITAIGTLTVTSRNPEVFATALMDADESTRLLDGHPGGAWHKLIRWSFERQGLYQPPGAPRPVRAAGAPPAVDVFLDDGRGGGYLPYLADPATAPSPDLWCRDAPDGGLAHQEPRAGTTSNAYVRVRNRGTQPASAVTVRLHQGSPAGGLRWPDGWRAAATAQLDLPGPIAPGGAAIAGPFAWTPSGGVEHLLASASTAADVSTLETVNGPLPHTRVVPLDNNAAERRVTAR